MSRTFLLFIPSALVVALLVLHSLRTRGRRETALFFSFALLFGVLRGNIIWWITTVHFGGRFPYLFTNRLIGIFHDALQADIGWILTIYVGYTTAEWLLRRFPTLKDSLFHILALSGLFAVCLSYAVESSAMTMGWWNWNLSTRGRFFLDVPIAGIAAWFSVPIDFLPPYLLLVRGSRRLRPWGIAALAIFPLHMLVHLSNQRVSGVVPLTPFNVFYWAAAMAALGLPFLFRIRLGPSGSRVSTARPSATPRAAHPAKTGRRPASAPNTAPAPASRAKPAPAPNGEPVPTPSAAPAPAREASEAHGRPYGIEWAIPVALAVVVLVLLLADLAIARQPALLVSLLPLAVYAWVVYAPLSPLFALGAGAIASVAWGREALFALVPGLLALLYTFQDRAPRARWPWAVGLGLPILLTVFFYQDAVERDRVDRLYAQTCARAQALAQGGDLDGAAREYDRATALKPESTRAWEESGLVHWKRKDLDRAEAAYREVLKRLPISPETWNSLGNVYFMRGDLPRALESYRQALKHDPSYEPAKKMIEQVRQRQEGQGGAPAPDAP